VAVEPGATLGATPGASLDAAQALLAGVLVTQPLEPPQWDRLQMLVATVTAVKVAVVVSAAAAAAAVAAQAAVLPAAALAAAVPMLPRCRLRAASTWS